MTYLVTYYVRWEFLFLEFSNSYVSFFSRCSRFLSQEVRGIYFLLRFFHDLNVRSIFMFILVWKVLFFTVVRSLTYFLLIPSHIPFSTYLLYWNFLVLFIPYFKFTRTNYILILQVSLVFFYDFLFNSNLKIHFFQK